MKFVGELLKTREEKEIKYIQKKFGKLFCPHHSEAMGLKFVFQEFEMYCLAVCKNIDCSFEIKFVKKLTSLFPRWRIKEYTNLHRPK